MAEVDAQLLEDLTNQFIDVGLTPTSGRILAWLLLAPEDDYSSVEIADGAGISRGAISTQTQVLAGRGMVVRFRKTGSREVYFRPEPAVAVELLQQVGRLATRLREIAEQEIARSGGSRRVEEFAAASTFVEEQVAAVGRAWAELPR